MSEADNDSEAAAGDAMATLVREMTAGFVADLEKRLAEQGNGAALALAFAAMSGATTFIAKTMGAAYAVETLDLHAVPFRDFLTEHGGPGVGVGH